MAKAKKKSLFLEVFVKDATKDFGLGVGVLLRQELTFSDSGAGFESPLFVVAQMNAEDKAVKEVIGTRWLTEKEAHDRIQNNEAKKRRNPRAFVRRA